ncbi:hypothetical protein ID866_4583, partial [Astraeus odoratus]
MRTRYGQNQSAVSVDTWLASKKCVTDVPFLLMIIAFLLYQIAFLYPLFYFQVDSLQHGLSSSFAFYSVSELSFTPPQSAEVRMGIGFAITGLGTLVGMPISGALLTSRYLWWAPALFCSVSFGGRRTLWSTFIPYPADYVASSFQELRSEYTATDAERLTF